jgi:cobalt-zinc-cadmium efflux system outer membrane protein
MRPARRTSFVTILFGLTALSAACTSLRGVPTPDQISDRIKERTGQGVRTLGEPGLPPNISLDDGLTQDEAVAIALWNNATFQSTLADLGIARADVAAAGLLRNPIFTLLLPWGPKQLEATAKLPVDAIWQRPRRLAAARATATAVAERLVAGALTLVADTRLAFVDLIIATRRVTLATEQLQLGQRIADLTRRRFEAGDISQLEADIAATEAARTQQDAERARLDVDLARNRLRELLGLGDTTPASTLQPAEQPARRGNNVACGEDTQSLERDAWSARPELRAAELEIEAAARRLGWEQSRIFSLVAILDANAQGKEGFELGPGIETDFGLFDRNQPGVMRASAELDRSKAHYVQVREQIRRELGDAYARLVRSRDAESAWRNDIRPRLERQAEQTQRAYQEGELSYLNVLDALRRLNEGRTRELDAAADVRRALIAVEKSLGRPCVQQS